MLITSTVLPSVQLIATDFTFLNYIYIFCNGTSDETTPINIYDFFLLCKIRNSFCF